MPANFKVKSSTVTMYRVECESCHHRADNRSTPEAAASVASSNGFAIVGDKTLCLQCSIKVKNKTPRVSSLPHNG